MPHLEQQLSQSQQMSQKIATLLQKRLGVAAQRYSQKIEQVTKQALTPAPLPANPWQMWADYGTDLAQRSLLFWDTLRQRGNTALEHELAGKPPVLHFDYEMVLDARHFEKPVNYALIRIVPPAGVVVDDKRRPYIIIDPRAGHGPGIGGFKDDSQVGVALRDGHPVYFVIFFPEAAFKILRAIPKDSMGYHKGLATTLQIVGLKAPPPDQNFDAKKAQTKILAQLWADLNRISAEGNAQNWQDYLKSSIAKMYERSEDGVLNELGFRELEASLVTSSSKN